MTDGADDSPLATALRAMGAQASPRLDGYDFQLSGVTGRYTLGEEDDEREEGPFTVCRVELPRGTTCFGMTLRPRTGRARSGERDVAIGDGAFDRTFVLEAAPSDVARVLLDDHTRAALLALAPCKLACRADHLTLSKHGTVVGSDGVAAIVRACLGVRDGVERLPEELARRRQPAGYRGARTILRPEDQARAAGELAAFERGERRRRRLRSAQVGLVGIGLAVVALAYAWCGQR